MSDDALMPTRMEPLPFINRIAYYLKHKWIMFRRKLPYIVWYGDELDVRVTLLDEELPPTPKFTNQEDALNWALQRFEQSGSSVARNALSKAGIYFDAGMGMGGMDWEWDYSLRGPISVRFRGKARFPEKRLQTKKPRLVVNNQESKNV